MSLVRFRSEAPPVLQFQSKEAAICGRSSSGRAPPCQGGGSEFEPRRPLQTNSKEPVYAGFLLIMVTWPSGKARVCKTLIPRFKSGCHLQKLRDSSKKLESLFFLLRKVLNLAFLLLGFSSEYPLENRKRQKKKGRASTSMKPWVFAFVLPFLH